MVSSFFQPPKLGRNLTVLREQKDISIEKLSSLTGISAEMLSQIEQEKTNPTVATMWKIVNGLGVPFQSMFRDESTYSHLFEILRKDETPTLVSGGCTIRINSPLHLADTLEMYNLLFQPHSSLQSKPHYRFTVEFLTIIDGSFTVTSGNKSGSVDSGDTVQYRADVDHCITNDSDADGEAYLVVKFRI